MTKNDAAKRVRAFAVETGKSRTKDDKVDEKDLNKLARLIEGGKNKEAYDFFRHLDTFVRDGVPEEVVSYLYLHRSNGKTRVIDVLVRVKTAKVSYRKGWPVGAVMRGTIEVPADAKDAEIGMWLDDYRRKILNEEIVVEFSDKKK